MLPLVLLNLNNLAKAEERNCYQEEILASSQKQTIYLYEQGITMEIPANYIAIKRRDNAVEVMSPNLYQEMQCGLRGGHLYHHGPKSLLIETVDNSFALSLEQLRKNLRINQGEIVTYTVNNIRMIITTYFGGYQAYFNSPQGIIRVSEYCDQCIASDSPQDFMEQILINIKPL